MSGTYQGQRRWSGKKNWRPRSHYQEQVPEPAPQPTAPVRRAAQVKGIPDLWVTLQSVTDPNANATKTTRAMRVPGGLLINTCTRGANYAAEALVLVPGADLLKTLEGHAIVEKARAV